MKRASEWMAAAGWLWLTSIVLRWVVIAGVAGLVSFAIWRS